MPAVKRVNPAQDSIFFASAGNFFGLSVSEFIVMFLLSIRIWIGLIVPLNGKTVSVS